VPGHRCGRVGDAVRCQPLGQFTLHFAAITASVAGGLSSDHCLRVRDYERITAILTSYPAEPLLTLLDPPIELTSSGPGSRLDRDGRANFSAVCFGHNRLRGTGVGCLAALIWRNWRLMRDFQQTPHSAC
jgi:hypothetical protein